jgi:hypothetical protein
MLIQIYLYLYKLIPEESVISLIKIIKMVLPLLLFVGSLFSQISVTPSGDGTPDKPYQISSLENLYWIAENSSRWQYNYNYEQTADINAAETKKWFNDSGWLPIGDESINFSGNYHGKGKRIDSLFINRPGNDYAGLFGITDNSQIDSLGVTNISVKSKNSAGGLVASNHGKVISCYSTGSVTGSTDVGGLVGKNYDTLKSCYSTCNVKGSSYDIAGLAGYNGYFGNIYYCYSTGNVNGSWAGGLVGYSLGNIICCYSTSSVTGSYYIGGLVGQNNFGGIIDTCYSTGVVSGSSSNGGLVGQNNDATVKNSFWDKINSGTTRSDGGTGKTTAEMKSIHTFIDSSWDFTNVWGINSKDNSGYPFLKWQGYIPEQPERISVTSQNRQNGIYIKLKQVSLSSFAANFRVDANVPSEIEINIYNIAGNLVYENTATCCTKAFNVNWNLCNKSGHRVGPGTYLIVAKVYNRANGSLQKLSTKLGLLD